MRVHPLRWKATRHFSSSRAAFARRLTGHERRPPEETCELVVGPTRSSSIFVRALSMSCTLLSHRSCSVVESDCSKALTCGLWDTNALNLQRRRRPRMLFCGTKGPTDMPIITVELVVETGESLAPGLAQAVADAVGRTLDSPPGQTWVRLHTLDRHQYAENDSSLNVGELPVFVNVLERHVPGGAALHARIAA